VRVLRLKMRRPCAAFCAALASPIEVGIGHLQIVLQGDARAVAQPTRDNVKGMVLRQFGFP